MHIKLEGHSLERLPPPIPKNYKFKNLVLEKLKHNHAPFGYYF